MKEEDSLLRRSLHGIGIVSSVTGFRIVANLATQMILTRLLAPEAFGVVAFATTVVGFCAFLTNVQGQKATIRVVAISLGFLGAGPWSIVGLKGCYAAHHPVT